MTIAVTAASGSLGRLVLDELLKEHSASDLVAIVRNADKVTDYAERGVDVRTASYDDPAALAVALAGVDRVLLISGTEFGQRAQQHANVISAAKQNGVSLLVYTSAPHADTSDLIVNPEHKATEETLINSGVPYTILRNNWYTENYFPAVDAALTTGQVLTSAPTGRVASASRADYAAGAARVLSDDGHVGKIYELAGDYAWNNQEFAAALTELAGRDISVNPVSAEVHTQILTDAGVPAETIGFVVPLDANIEAGDLSDASGELAKLIGRPTTPLIDGLRPAVATA